MKTQTTTLSKNNSFALLVALFVAFFFLSVAVIARAQEADMGGGFGAGESVDGGGCGDCGGGGGEHDYTPPPANYTNPPDSVEPPGGNTPPPPVVPPYYPPVIPPGPGDTTIINTNTNNTNITNNTTNNTNTTNTNITNNSSSGGSTNHYYTSAPYSYYTSYAYPGSYTYPVCTLTASASVANPGQPVTLAWTSSNTLYGTLPGFGSIGTQGSGVVYPTRTTTYTATFVSQNAQAITCSALVYVAGTVPVTISLSAVPYTGLDLGPVGTFAYWGFLVLWALFGAYLLVVRRAHVALVGSFKTFLFGSDTAHAHTDTHANVEHAHTDHGHGEAHAAHAVAHTAAPVDTVDPFIQSQINKLRN